VSALALLRLLDQGQRPSSIDLNPRRSLIGRKVQVQRPPPPDPMFKCPRESLKQKKLPGIRKTAN